MHGPLLIAMPVSERTDTVKTIQSAMLLAPSPVFMLLCLGLGTAARLNDSAYHHSPSLRLASRCDSRHHWQAYAFLVEDCFTAIQQMYISDVMRHPDVVYEFTSPGTRAKARHPRVQTPSWITVGKLLPKPHIPPPEDMYATTHWITFPCMTNLVIFRD